MSEAFRLPDGSTTKSATKYIKTWKRLSNDVLSICPDGYYIIGYDPSLLIGRGRRATSFDVPSDLALGIQRLVQQKRT